MFRNHMAGASSDSSSSSSSSSSSASSSRSSTPSSSSSLLARLSVGLSVASPEDQETHTALLDEISLVNANVQKEKALSPGMLISGPHWLFLTLHKLLFLLRRCQNPKQRRLQRRHGAALGTTSSRFRISCSRIRFNRANSQGVSRNHQSKKCDGLWICGFKTRISLFQTQLPSFCFEGSSRNLFRCRALKLWFVWPMLILSGLHLKH